MLLNLISSNPPKKDPSKAPQPEFLAENIIKAIEKKPVTQPKPPNAPSSKNAFFDMFHENQEETNKSLRGEKLLAKVLLSRKKDPDEKESIKALLASKQGGARNSHSSGQKRSSGGGGNRSRKPNKAKEFDLEEEKDEKPKVEKKHEVKLKPVSANYLEEMAKLSDIDALFKLNDGHIARLAGHLKVGLKEKKEGDKRKDLEKEEDTVIKKLNLKDDKDEIPNVKPVRKYDPTAFKADLVKIKSNKQNERTNIEQPVNIQKKIEVKNEKMTQKVNKPIENNNNKKAYDPFANNNIGTGNRNINNNQNNEKKNTNVNNVNNANKANNANNKIGDKNLKLSSSVSGQKKQYNPLETKNSNVLKTKEVGKPILKPNSQISNTLSKINPQPNPNLKRKIRDLYSDDEEEEEEEEELDDSFIDDDVEAPTINVMSTLRKITRYDPRKFRDDDSDDANMEVGYNQIELEERVSSMIGRKEDEREFKYIQKEMEKEMKKKKK